MAIAPFSPGPGRVLVVDDEKNITYVIHAILRKAGYEVTVFNDSMDALSSMGDEELDLVVTDLYMPGPDGMEVLKFCQKNYPALPVVFITAFGTVESAVAALKCGAFDFITKPFDQGDLLEVVQKAVQTHQSRRKEPITIPATRAASSEAESPAHLFPLSSIIGASAKMKEIPMFWTKWHPPLRRFSSRGKAARARSSSRPCTPTSTPRPPTVHQGQLRRNSRNAARKRALRPRARRIHRRDRTQGRQIRSGRRRNDLPRRDRRHRLHQCRSSSARPAGARVRTHRREPHYLSVECAW